MSKSPVTLFVLVMVVAVVLAAGCIQPPKSSSGSSSSGSSSGSGSASGTAGVKSTQGAVTSNDPTNSSNATMYLTPVTPYQTATTAPPHAPVFPPEQLGANETYLVLYNATLPFMYNTVAYAYNLTNPPLYIDFSVKPKMITDKKAYTSRTGSKEEGEVTTTYASPSSWFEVTVRDRETGAIILQDGYGKTFGSETAKEVLVRKGGDLQLDFRGNEANVTITLKVKQPPQ